MKRSEPEQLNNEIPAPSQMPEFTLEEIMQEFGGNPIVAEDTAIFQPLQPEEPSASPSAQKIQPPAKKPSAPQEPPRPRQKERIAIAPAPQTVSPAAALKQCRKKLGSTRLRFGCMTVVALMSLMLMCYHAFQMQFLPFLTESVSRTLSLASLLLSVLLGFDVLWQGLTDLFRLRISVYTLSVVVSVLCCIDSLQNTPDYCSIAVLIQWQLFRGLIRQRLGMFHTLHTVCSLESPMGIYRLPDLLPDAASLRRDSGNLTDFMTALEQPDAAARMMRVYSSILLPMTLISAVLFALRRDIDFVRCWMLLLLGAIPCAAALSFSKPFSVLAKKLTKFGGALCGWHSAEVLGGKQTIILRDADLFPADRITSNGMKLYGAFTPAQVIAFALAALNAADHPLCTLFESLLQAQFGKHLRADEFRFYDNGGIGAEVNGCVVLVGTLSFMRSMGVHMPEGARVRQAMYVSVSGELAGVFAIKYKPSGSTKAGLRAILSNPSVNVILASRDFLITPELVALKYGVPVNRLIFPIYSERIRLSAPDNAAGVMQGAFVAKDTFGSFASTVAAGQTLRSCTLLSAGLNLFAGTLGVVLCALLILWNSVAIASPLHLAAFQLLWSVLTSFISFILLRF